MTAPSDPFRLRECNSKPIRGDGNYVLYWMTSNRRPVWNHALDRAIEHCQRLDKPLLVLEALRVGYAWASDRMHSFVMDGMRDNLRAFEKADVRYYPYVERSPGQGKGLLKHLAASACVVVTDDWPHFFFPRMLQAASKQVPVLLEALDSVGLWPVRGRQADWQRSFARAFDFRRFLQKELAPALAHAPQANPWSTYKPANKARVPAGTEDRWPEASEAWLQSETSLGELPIDHSVAPTGLRGGPLEAGRLLKRFVSADLSRYNEKRTDLDSAGTSGLSPFLHFGHVSSHQILGAIGKAEGWGPKHVQGAQGKVNGARLGWWGMGEAAETFLDQLVTWRELGFNGSAFQADFGKYAGLPDWAQKTLAEHAQDAREYVYKLEQFEQAETHDELWNAAQNQLRNEGYIHNYMRMLWGKKILHWSKTPKQAFQVMVQLNNKYALDGRDPNSYSGIGWVCGLYDRAWGPEREIFGKIRYMTSDSTRRKLRVQNYIRRHTQTAQQGRLFP